MCLLRVFGKALTVPVVVVVTLLQLLMALLVSFSSVVFCLLAVLFLAIAGLSLTFGVASWLDALKMIIAGGIAFLLPIIGRTVLSATASFRGSLLDFLKS